LPFLDLDDGLEEGGLLVIVRLFGLILVAFRLVSPPSPTPSLPLSPPLPLSWSPSIVPTLVSSPTAPSCVFSCSLCATSTEVDPPPSFVRRSRSGAPAWSFPPVLACGFVSADTSLLAVSAAAAAAAAVVAAFVTAPRSALRTFPELSRQCSSSGRRARVVSNTLRANAAAAASTSNRRCTDNDEEGGEEEKEEEEEGKDGSGKDGGGADDDWGGTLLPCGLDDEKGPWEFELKHSSCNSRAVFFSAVPPPSASSSSSPSSPPALLLIFADLFLTKGSSTPASTTTTATNADAGVGGVGVRAADADSALRPLRNTHFSTFEYASGSPLVAEEGGARGHVVSMATMRRRGG